MSRTATPKVPGEVAAESTETVESQAAEGAQVESVSGDTVTVEKAQLDALLAQVAELSNKVRGMETTKAGSKFVVPTKDLPDAGTLDANELKSPVLTKQGWLVPEKFGSNPNAPKAF